MRVSEEPVCIFRQNPVLHSCIWDLPFMSYRLSRTISTFASTIKALTTRLDVIYFDRLVTVDRFINYLYAHPVWKSTLKCDTQHRTRKRLVNPVCKPRWHALPFFVTSSLVPAQYCSTRVQGPVPDTSGETTVRAGQPLPPHTDKSSTRLHGGLDSFLQVTSKWIRIWSFLFELRILFFVRRKANTS